MRSKRPNFALATSTFVMRSQVMRKLRPPRSNTCKAESVTTAKASPLNRSISTSPDSATGVAKTTRSPSSDFLSVSARWPRFARPRSSAASVASPS